jgi:hypothetical protein
MGCFPYFQCVITMFPSSSQGVALCFQNVPQVLNVFPNVFPIAIHFLFHTVWPWFKVPILHIVNDTMVVKLFPSIHPSRHPSCCNPSFGLATKARGLQGCGPRRSPGVTPHAPGSVRK